MTGTLYSNPYLITLPTPDYSNPMLPPQLPSYTKPNSADSTTMLPLTNPSLNALNAPVNLSFSSDNGGSPVPRSSRPSLSRPPTSNPSPYLAKDKNNPTSPPQDNFSPPPPPPLQNPLKQRPRFNSSQKQQKQQRS